MAIERYLQHALSLPLADVTDLCEFLSSNVIDKSQYAKVSSLSRARVRQYQLVVLTFW